MITWHARVYNLRKYRPATAYFIKLGKSGTRRSPGHLGSCHRDGGTLAVLKQGAWSASITGARLSGADQA
jgi:hypothetical protein